MTKQEGPFGREGRAAQRGCLFRAEPGLSVGGALRACAEEPEAPPTDPPEEDPVQLNVGGWCFSLPRSKVAQFPESLLWQAAEGGPGRLFLDRDGCAFRHLHLYLLTGRLSLSSCAELGLLYEQALRLRLAPLLQTLDNIKEGKHNLRIRPADIPIAERASMNYWRTRKCISKPSELPLKSPAFTGLHEKAPLGLMDTPLLETEEEVHYCFLPLDLVEKYPSLVNDDNLLWLSDNAVLIECESSEFRFIANFLRSEKILLPDNFSHMDVLEAEAEALGIPEVTEAVKIYKASLGVYLEETPDPRDSMKSLVEEPWGARAGKTRSLPLPLYPMVLGLLVKYPDSALGQLHVESTLDGNKLYISGNGVLFQHVMNWLGTCRLPLIRNMSELPELCAYLDQMDVTYEPMKDALKIYLNQQTSTDIRDANWAADVAIFSPLHIVKVYAGSHWYATYLQTLLKFPELLSNCKKAIWIAYGQSLLIHGDGQMFRHILNFLRLGKLFLPPEFKEWSLLCQEVVEYQIPSLVEALHQYDTYRLWVQQQQAQREVHPFQSLQPRESEKEQECGEDPPELSHLGPASTWSIMRDTLGTKASARENGKASRPSPTKGAKRRNSGEGSCQPTEGWAHACSCRQPESPPRKRAGKGNGPKKLENRDTPIQKLISLVQGWDMVNWGPLVSGGLRAEEELGKRAPCNLPLASSPGPAGRGPSLNGPTVGAAPGAHGSLSKAGQCTLGTSAPEHCLVKSGGPSAPVEIHPAGEGVGGKELSSQKEGERGTFPNQTSSTVSHEPPGHAGLILKMEHPPIVACDGSCLSHEGSVLYSTCLEGLNVARAPAEPAPQEIVFLSFPLSQEEIFYARKCHGFLTDIILDSIRHKDPKRTTARIQLLVQRLWSLQITAREFVADLLDVPPFKASSCTCEKLLKWVEFSLPFAWKYSSCIDLLIRKGYFKSLSHFVIGKYLQKSE